MFQGHRTTNQLVTEATHHLNRHHHYGDHSRRVGQLCFLMAKATGASESEQKIAQLAGELHDFGKIGDPLFENSRSWSARQKKQAENHPVIGALAIEQIVPNATGKRLALAVLCSHCWHDKSSGYPQKIGTEPPVEAGIIRICDSLDAMTDPERPWNGPPKTLNQAVAEIQTRSGTEFNPKLANIIMDLCSQGRLQSIVAEASHPL